MREIDSYSCDTWPWQVDERMHIFTSSDGSYGNNEAYIVPILVEELSVLVGKIEVVHTMNTMNTMNSCTHLLIMTHTINTLGINN